MSETVGRDASFLRMLALGFFLLAGVLTLSAIFVSGNTIEFIFQGPSANARSGSAGGLEKVDWIALGAFLLKTLIQLPSLLLAGWNLGKRTRYRTCAIAAGIACIEFPIGTALGVLTLVHLTRPGVRELYRDRVNVMAGAEPVPGA